MYRMKLSNYFTEEAYSFLCGIVLFVLVMVGLYFLQPYFSQTQPKVTVDGATGMRKVAADAGVNTTKVAITTPIHTAEISPSAKDTSLKLFRLKPVASCPVGQTTGSSIVPKFYINNTEVALSKENDGYWHYSLKKDQSIGIRMYKAYKQLSLQSDIKKNEYAIFFSDDNDKPITIHFTSDNVAVCVPNTTPTLSPTPSPTAGPSPTLAPLTIPAQIGDYVWEDSNTNGLQDVGEGPVSGIHIQLLRCSDATVAVQNTQTDGQGKYLFNNLSAGCYKLRFYTPTGYTLCSSKNVDSGSKPTIDSDIHSTGNTDEISIIAGQSHKDIDACMIRVKSAIDLSLSMTVSKTNPQLWQDITYFIMVQNASGNQATDVHVKNYMPSGLLYVSHEVITDPQEVFEVKEGIWNVGTLPGGGSKELAITMKVISLNNTTNIAEIYSAYEPDIDSVSNNLITTEDDYSSLAISPRSDSEVQGISDEVQSAQLANTGVSTMLAFGLGAGLMVTALVIEEMRVKVGVCSSEDEE